MNWKETDDLPTVLAALHNRQWVQMKISGGWASVDGADIIWISRSGNDNRFRIEVPDEPDAPSLPPGVVATWKAQAKDCPRLVDAGWTVRWPEDGDIASESGVRWRAAVHPDLWFEVCPPAEDGPA